MNTHPVGTRAGARPSRRGRDQRGMVTAEIAVASLAATVVLVVLAAVLHLGTVQLRLGDIAAETARQAARGDDAAVQRARRGAPDGTRITIRQQADQVHVRAELRQRLPVGDLDLHADAWVVAE